MLTMVPFLDDVEFQRIDIQQGPSCSAASGVRGISSRGNLFSRVQEGGGCHSNYGHCVTNRTGAGRWRQRSKEVVPHAAGFGSLVSLWLNLRRCCDRR